MVHFVGAGCGAKDLITVRGRRLLEKADIIIYAGSLVNPQLLEYAPAACEIYDSAAMTLDEIIDTCSRANAAGKDIVRLHTGDPSLYGAIYEQMEELKKLGIEYDMCPGVSAYQGAAASMCTEYTRPGMSQSIILTRVSGKTKVRNEESLRALASHGATIVLYLSSSLALKAREELVAAGMNRECPVAVVYKASWPDEKIIYCKIADFPEKMEEAGIYKTALIIVGEVLKDEVSEYSRLYASDFATEYRNTQSGEIRDIDKKCGYTSGAVAAAVSLAAAVRVFDGEVSEYAKLELMAGEEAVIPVFELESGENYAVYGSYKDSGDDPDVTNGCLIQSRVERIDGIPDKACFTEDNIYLCGGKGIGIVTKAGLEQETGMPAINKVPRDMIFKAVRSAAGAEKVLVTIEIPDGEELSKRTFNGRMGIEGGLSILGTTGILRPMSDEAVLDTVKVQLRQRSVLNRSILYMTPGNIGVNYLSDNFGIEREDIVECSNYIGEAVKCAGELGFSEICLAGDAGKLCKIALGIWNTHSKVADGRAESFAYFAMKNNVTKEAVERISDSISTEAMTDILVSEDKLIDVGNDMAKAINQKLSKLTDDTVRIRVYIFSVKYGMIGKSEE